MKHPILLPCLLIATIAHGQITLDPSFGTGGITITDLGWNQDQCAGMALQTDGKVLLCGTTWNGTDQDFALVRYNADGTPDASFGTNGVVTTAVGVSDDQCMDILLQPDGKIILTGFVFALPTRKAVLVRYNSDGTMDSSFGINGIAADDLGGTDSWPVSLAVQPDGKILLSGGWGGPEGDFLLARYLADGTLDGSFGSGGYVINAVNPGNDSGNDIAVLGDGRVLVAGDAFVGSNYDFAVMRFLADGTLDTSFGTAGTTFIPVVPGNSQDYCTALLVQPDGKLVLAGSIAAFGSWRQALARCDADGALDISFGTSGITTETFSFSDPNATDAILLPDGKFLLCGWNVVSFVWDFALSRFDPDGTPDLSFDGDGIFNTEVGSENIGKAVVLQPDGKILLAGNENAGTPSGSDLCVLRYVVDDDIGVDETAAVDGSLSIVPQPVIDIAMVSLPRGHAAEVSCSILDVEGREVRHLDHVAVAEGDDRFRLDLSGLRSGEYVVTLSDGRSSGSAHLLKVDR